jgi:hypothetical protein
MVGEGSRPWSDALPGRAQCWGGPCADAQGFVLLRSL